MEDRCPRYLKASVEAGAMRSGENDLMINVIPTSTLTKDMLGKEKGRALIAPRSLTSYVLLEALCSMKDME